jgi:hypothetical protein
MHMPECGGLVGAAYMADEVLLQVPHLLPAHVVHPDRPVVNTRAVSLTIPVVHRRPVSLTSPALLCYAVQPGVHVCACGGVQHANPGAPKCKPGMRCCCRGMHAEDAI